MDKQRFIEAIHLFYQYADKYIVNGGDFRFVGGCVRDYQTGSNINDIDIVATDVKQLVHCIAEKLHSNPQYRVDIAFYENSQTHLVKIVSDNYRYTYELSQLKGNDFTEDAINRDFTINALYIKLDNGNIVIEDPLGMGLDDLESKVLRACNGYKTFIASPIRLFRLVRFIGKGYEVGDDNLMYLTVMNNPTKFDWFYQYAKKYIAFNEDPEQRFIEMPSSFELITGKCIPEAVKTEVDKLFVSANDYLALTYALDTGIKFGLFDYFAPEFSSMDILQKNQYHNETILEHTLGVVKYVFENVDHNRIDYVPLMWAALLHDIGKTRTLTIDDDGTTHFYYHEKEGVDIFNEFARKFKFSNYQINVISFLIEHHMDTKCFCNLPFSKMKRKIVRKLMYTAGSKDLFDALMVINDADIAAMYHESEVENIDWIYGLHSLIKQIEKEEPSFYSIKLPIAGNEIKDLTGCEDRKIGEYIKYLIKHTIGNPEQTDTKEKCVKLVLGAHI